MIEWNAPDGREVLPCDRRAYIGGVLNETTYGDGPPADGLVSLLSDIRHYCDAQGLDFGVVDREAMERYRDELVSQWKLKEWGRSLKSDSREERAIAAYTLAAVVTDGPERFADRAAEWLRGLSAEQLAELPEEVRDAVAAAVQSHRQPAMRLPAVASPIVAADVCRAR